MIPPRSWFQRRRQEAPQRRCGHSTKECCDDTLPALCSFLGNILPSPDCSNGGGVERLCERQGGIKPCASACSILDTLLSLVDMSGFPHRFCNDQCVWLFGCFYISTGYEPNTCLCDDENFALAFAITPTTSLLLRIDPPRSAQSGLQGVPKSLANS